MKHQLAGTVLACLVGFTATAQDDRALLKKAHKIHEKAFTVDTHADTPMLLSRGDFDVTKDNDPRITNSKVDYPRMRKGGLDAIFWAVYLGQGPRTPEGHEAAKKKAMAIFDAIDATLKKTTSEAQLATTPEEAFAINRSGKRVIFLGVENGYPMGHDLGLLREFYNKGARYMTLCHSSNNDICDSSTDPKGAEYQGLSPLGEQVVAEMNRLGMMIDVSHVSDSTFYDVVRLSKVPIIASHSGAKAICDHPRNLTDAMLKALAKNGGVIQLNLLSDYVKTIPPSPQREAAQKTMMEKWGVKDRRGMMAALSRLSEEDQKKLRDEFTELNKKFPVQLATVKDAVDHIDHIVKLIGIDHVGMGADFDGGGALADCFDVSQYENFTVEFLRRGYSKKDIEKIWGGNFFRVMKAVDKGKTMEVASN
ncbi:membrane dipeptidase [Fibrisoma limi BUZ 3]|uniref:Membrane dipeptidase n=1 Tax=Fibrisoma limi BUZ 3 TaxID=1185876 RepID=I2GLT2_9BACT|nr:dipeptidase [Fibrisoma limi]CCH54858.1 membrane dipeptidase [Fibrisoma limi BUZ 3]